MRPPETLVRIAESLARDLAGLQFFAPVAYVYNPLEYAWGAHRDYLRRYGRHRRPVLLVGMNPGPWGMAQTGVPFGTVSLVRDWLKIDGSSIGKPPKEHPKRPVEGFACPREEVSGARLWGWARHVWGTPREFFARFFVANYCPLLFLDEGGRNLTPDKLRVREREPLLEPCDRALVEIGRALEVETVVGVGAFAQQRALRAFEGEGVTVGRILHPSPASPAANRGWRRSAERQLRELGVELPR